MFHTQTYNFDELRGWSGLLKPNATVQYVCVCLLRNLEIQKGQKISAIKWKLSWGPPCTWATWRPETRVFPWFQTFAVFWMLYAFFWVITGGWSLYPDVSEHYVCSIFIGLWRWNRQSVPKRRHINFRRRGITKKKAYNMLYFIKHSMTVEATQQLFELKEMATKPDRGFYTNSPPRLCIMRSMVAVLSISTISRNRTIVF
jgi:hypothetical protein